MQHYYSFSLNTLFIIIFSISCEGSFLYAQEQMTNIQGDPCCSNVREILKVDSQYFSIAKDDYNEFRIYEVDGQSSELIYSNEGEDISKLLAHGQYRDRYYFIYTLKLELYNFKTKELTSHPIPGEIKEDELDAELPFLMTDYGLLINPSTVNDSFRFVNIIKDEVFQLKNFKDRGTDLHAIDSFLVFTYRSQDSVSVRSFNLLEKTYRDVLKFSGNSMIIEKVNGILSIKKDRRLYITRGKQSNTYFLFEYEGEDHKLHALGSGDHISFIDQGKRFNYKKYIFDRNGQLLDESTLTNYRFGPFDSFYSIDGKKLVAFSNQMSILDFSENEITKIGEFSSSAYWIDSTHTFYINNDSLIQFNNNTLEKEQAISLENYYQRLDLVRSGQDELYLVSYEKDRQAGLYLADLKKGEIIEVIKLDEYNEGLYYYGTLQNIDSLLFLQSSVQSHPYIFDGREFVELPFLKEYSQFVKYRNSYYIMGSEGKLYQWKGGSKVEAVIEGMEYYRSGPLTVKNDKLYFYDRFRVFELHPEIGSYTALRPNDTIKISEVVFGHDPDYFIFNSSEQSEVWSYDTEKEKWLKILSENNYRNIWLGRYIPAAIANDQLIWVEHSSAGIRQISRVDLQSADFRTLVQMDQTYRNASSHYFGQCGGQVLFTFSKYRESFHRLWVTDGTEAGTQLLDDNEPFFGFVPSHRYKDTLFFISSDTAYTRIHAFECSSKQYQELPWSQTLLLEDQIELNGKTFVIGYDNIYDHNGVIASRNGNQITTIGISAEYSEDMKYAKLNDTLLVISGVFDDSGEGMWYLNDKGDLKRALDFGRKNVVHRFKDFALHEGYIYFVAYKYGPGRQVWRIPLEKTTSVHGPEYKVRSLTLAPNPAVNEVIISDLNTEAQKIMIYNSAGQQIDQVHKTAAQASMSINVSNYTTGVYFIRIVGENGQQSGVFVKGE